MNKDFSKCDCANPGWCNLFDKEMSDNPPNWQWCQSLSEGERKEYFNNINNGIRTLRKAMKRGRVDIINFYDELPDKKSDYAICVIPANDTAMEFLDITRESIKKYAEKCEADYIELAEDQHPDWPMANKYRVHKVAQTYEKTLYLDCDVIINSKSPNIFQCTPDDKISAYDEYQDWEDRNETEWIHDQQELILYKTCSPKIKNNLLKNGEFKTSSMLNGGVLMIPRDLADYYKQPEIPYLRMWCFDQHLLTLLLPKDKLCKLERIYNCTYTSSKFYEEYRNAYFIHINSLGKDPGRRKLLLNNSKVEITPTVIHEDFSICRTFHHCEEAIKKQKLINVKLKEYVNKQQVSKNSTKDVCILCLGHSDAQFKSIEDRHYLKKVNLNTLDCGEYSGNEWAESRGFLFKEEIFPPSAEFYGFVTASWNLKYLNHSKIDDFHNWNSTAILLNSKPEDKVVLCADIFCWCNWINDNSCIGRVCILRSLLKREIAIPTGRTFLKLMGLNFHTHKRVPYSNQQIFHKSLYFEWKKFLDDNDCLEKIKWFVNKIKDPKLGSIPQSKSIEYSNARLNAYFMEMLNILWYTNNEFKIICNTTRKELWYSVKEMKDRLSIW